MGIGVGDNLNPMIAARIAKAETEAHLQSQKIKEIEQNINHNTLDHPMGYTSEEILKMSSSKQDEIEEDEIIKPDKNAILQKDIESIPDECVMIIGGPCGVILKPKEFRIESNFIIVILNEDDNKSFLLTPGSKLKFYYKQIDSEAKGLNVFYSGISFKYEGNFMLVFHIYNQEGDDE